MKAIFTFIILLFLIQPLCSKSLVENPVNADIFVASDGSGDFTTLQAAINAAPSNSERRTIIYIKRGLYNAEKLIVPGNKINISLIGESREETIISYHIYDCNGGKCPTADAEKWTGDNMLTSATLSILGNGFRAENITIQNTAGPVGQAQAITVRADKCIFINVNFYGYQDTMYFWSDKKRSYFEGCLVVGRTDYIYGSGTVFFQSCEIRSWGSGWITAPSTYQDQPFGFVFNECNITYAVNSPRGGDDGELVRFGRPWHGYPKVAWLYCEITKKIHPQGWGDKWNMEYADTSADLHLYEYKNTGPGAETIGRADWAGIKVLNDQEALNYSVQKVMAGTDGWDPTAEAQIVQTYKWTGDGANNSWLTPENWDPAGTPASGQTAEIDSAFIVVANGDTFPADLILKNKATLNISASSTAPFISVSSSTIYTDSNVSLNGKISTKDSLTFSMSGVLDLNSGLTGVHPLQKTGTGTLVLLANNSEFSGNIQLVEGTLEAAESGSLGKSSIKVDNGATLTIGNNNSVYAKAKLEVFTGSQIQLNANVTISEFYINGELQQVGEYNASSNPELISGTGKIIIGRPGTFVFHRGSSGNWDNPAHFTPALLPEKGETVIVEEEMETTSTVFTADLVIQNTGNLRLRGAHRSTGTVFMKEGTNFKYNTGGSGMSLEAPIVMEGDVFMIMESGNSSGSTLALSGPISGSSKITTINNGKGTPNNGNLLLTGNNSNFSGTWDLTQYSTKYPGNEGYITTIEGNSENAFGKGKINVGLQNKVIFSHSKAAGDSLVLTLSESAKVLLNTNVVVKKYVLNGNPVEAGEYSVTTHPDIYEGIGKIIVGESDTIPVTKKLPAFPGAEGQGKYVTGGRGGRVIYVTSLDDNNNPGTLRYAIGQTGPRIILFKVSGTIQLKSKLNITKGDVTIAGQTAPGDGITLRDYPVSVDANNVIIRFLRFRMGDETNQEADALGGRYHKNIIVDHCSMSWSTDECVSFYHNENFTMQWCILSESLRNSVHGKGAHGYGGIWGGSKASFHHNLLAHHDSRNPRFNGSRFNNRADLELVDHRNNVIYNWGGNSCYGAEGGNYNLVNNYYKPGPATSSSKKSRIIQPNPDNGDYEQAAGVYGIFYVNGNFMTASTTVTNNNRLGVEMHSSFSTLAPGVTKADILSDTEFSFGEVTTHTAEKAYEKVIQYCGASLKYDSVDVRILKDVETGTATFMNGGNGSKNGIIDTQGAVGGWPVLASLNAPVDSDEDGMPDNWENANDLNPYDGNDAQLKSVDGNYPNIEVYINSLVSDIIVAQNQEGVSTATGDLKINNTALENIKVYFNSSEQKIVITHSEKITDYKIYSITGQHFTSKQVNQEELKIDALSLKNGIYIVSVRDSNNQVFAKKVVKF